MKLPTEIFLRAKLDNDMSTFFVDNSDQKFLLFQNLGAYKDAYTPTLALIPIEQVVE